MFKNPIFIYIGFAIAVIAIILGVIKPEFSSTAWMVAAIFGFGTASAARTFINSKGWLTHTIGVVIGGLVVLQLSGVITPEQFNEFVIAFTPLTGISFAKALGNDPGSNFPKLFGG